MTLSDISIRRPVFATVISLMLVILGLVSLTRIAVREYPDVDPVFVSVTTDYRGAGAAIVAVLLAINLTTGEPTARTRSGWFLLAAILVLSSLQVLLVEDNDINALLARRMLEKAGCEVRPAVNGREAVELFDDDHDGPSRGHLELAGELRRAIEQGELVLHYQPKASLDGGAVDCVEALVRWQHPRRGLLAPDTFLPIAERHGLMRRITFVVVESALGQQAAWRADGIDLTVAVNLAGADLLDTRFPQEVADLLEGAPRPRFDLDHYKILARHLSRGRPRVVELGLVAHPCT